MIVPGPSVPVPIPSPAKTEKLDPDVKRNVIIDQFGKGARVEVLYV